MFRTIALASGLMTMLAAPTWAQQEGTQSEGGELFTVLEESGNYGTLIKALEASDATWFLEDDMSYTLLAPTDAAFDKLPDGVLDALLTEENRPKLNAILERHLIPDDAMASSDVTGESTLDPATGEPLEVATEGEQVMIGSAAVTQANLATDYGVIHGIDDVLVPEIVVEAMKYREEWPEDSQ